MRDKIQDLRHHLFETIEQLKDGDMEIDRAKAICDVSGRIIETAKTEIDYLRATDQIRGSEFLQSAVERAPTLGRRTSHD